MAAREHRVKHDAELKFDETRAELTRLQDMVASEQASSLRNELGRLMDIGKLGHLYATQILDLQDRIAQLTCERDDAVSSASSLESDHKHRLRKVQQQLKKAQTTTRTEKERADQCELKCDAAVKAAHRFAVSYARTSKKILARERTSHKKAEKISRGNVANFSSQLTQYREGMSESFIAYSSPAALSPSTPVSGQSSLPNFATLFPQAGQASVLAPLALTPVPSTSAPTTSMGVRRNARRSVNAATAALKRGCEELISDTSVVYNRSLKNAGGPSFAADKAQMRTPARLRRFAREAVKLTHQHSRGLQSGLFGRSNTAAHDLILDGCYNHKPGACDAGYQMDIVT